MKNPKMFSTAKRKTKVERKRGLSSVLRVPMGKNYHGTTVMLPVPNYDHKSMEVGLKKEPEGGTEDGRVISRKTG